MESYSPGSSGSCVEAKGPNASIVIMKNGGEVMQLVQEYEH